MTSSKPAPPQSRAGALVGIALLALIIGGGVGAGGTYAYMQSKVDAAQSKTSSTEVDWRTAYDDQSDALQTCQDSADSEKDNAAALSQSISDIIQLHADFFGGLWSGDAMHMLTETSSAVDDSGTAADDASSSADDCDLAVSGVLLPPS